MQRIPRKLKKKLISDCGLSEFECQKYLIKIGILKKFVVIK